MTHFISSLEKFTQSYRAVIIQVTSSLSAVPHLKLNVSVD